MATAVTFFEISGPKGAQLRRFYGDVLGLPVEAPDETGYALVTPREGAIPGGLWDASAAWQEPESSYLTVYVEVDDVDSAVQAAQAAGGKVVIPRREHGPTVIAHLQDPAGNRVGVFTQRPAG